MAFKIKSAKHYAATFIALGVMAASTSAFAQLRTINAKSGQEVLLENAGVYNVQKCTASPRPKLTGFRAKNGKVRMVNSGGKLDKGVCKGLTVKGVAFIYRSNPGFKGTDNVVVNFKFPAADGAQFDRAMSKRFRVVVK